MSAIAYLSSALQYDACEAALAAGMSLATVYALAAARTVVPAEDEAPVSGIARTELATARPGRK